MGCECESMSPGMTVRPRRSILFPTSRARSASVPLARINPFLMASACTIERRGSCVAMRPLNRTISAASAPMAGDPPMYAKSLPLRAVNPGVQRGDDETAHHRDVLLGDQPLAERRLRRQGPEGMR